MDDFDAPTSRWLFTKEQLKNSPSRQCGLKAQKEFSFRQQATFLIQDMGMKLHVSQRTINTAIVYMQRFYMLQSFTKCHKNDLCPAALFLAAKAEEEPRALEDVLKVSHACLTPHSPYIDPRSQVYEDKAEELLSLERVLLQTLGFDLTIEHPYDSLKDVVKSLRATKAFKSIFLYLTTNSLLSPLCLQYSPSVVACVCVQVACKWFDEHVSVSSKEKCWWKDVAPTLTSQLLDELTSDFMDVLKNSPDTLPKREKGPDIKDLNPGIMARLTPRNREELAALNRSRAFYTRINPFAVSRPIESEKPTSACGAGKSTRKRSRSKEATPTPTKVAKSKD